jgi:tyrosyl-tRNA synthetase
MDKIEELLTRGVDTIYPTKDDLEKVLRSGKKLKLYQGFDPTGTQLHIGHMVGFRKLRQWQELGHEVIFLIGDGTGQAGDPSGKIKARDKFFSRDELRKNAHDYVKQASKIVDFEGKNAIKILYNGEWLNDLNLPNLLEIIGHLSLQQLLERDFFQERMKQNQTISMREFIYPILQGYDSVAMEVDLELGGSDQMFNMLVGRQLVKDYLNKEKFVMTTPLLVDSEGRKIGKTEGNVIGLTDEPEDLFAKIMGLGDETIIKGFEYLTDLPTDQIDDIIQELNQGKNPIHYKKKLAYNIVLQLNDEKKTKKAQELFEKRVQRGEKPDDIPTITASDAFDSGRGITDVLLATGLAGTKSEAKRLTEQGGVELILTKGTKRMTEPKQQVDFEEGMILKVGRRKFVKIILKK